MYLYRLLILFASLIFYSAFAMGADKSQAINVDIELKQISKTQWHVTYRFPQKISALDFGQNLVAYRANSWHSTSPKIVHHESNHGDAYITEHPLSQWDFGIKLFQFYPENSYLPVSTFSDGSVVFDLGQLVAEVQTVLGWKPIRPHFSLSALQGHQALFLTDDSDEIPSYVYFGTLPVLQNGHLKLLIDPKLPSWLFDIFSDEILEKLIQFYQKKLPPLKSKNTTLIVVWATPPKDHFESKILGGEINHQLIFTLYGRGFEIDSLLTKQTLLKTLAHEVAHLWQPQLSVDVQNPELHEGGAEWLAVNTLLATQLWTKNQYNNFNQKMQYQCQKNHTNNRQVMETPSYSYSNAYACGYLYFESLPVDGFKLWTTLLSASKHSQSPIDQPLIDKMLKQGNFLQQDE